MKKILITVLLSLLISVHTLASAANLTVAEVHKDMSTLAGKQVTISGKVVKVNNGIMRRNFIHITDGTGSGNTAKLIITSAQTASVGNNVTVTGTVVLDTDFGMGYKYPLLVEKSSITINK